MSYTFTLLTSQLSAEGDNGCVGISLGANEDGVAYIPHEYANVNGTRDVRISALGVDELLTKYDTCKFVISYTWNGVGNLRIKIKKPRRKPRFFYLQWFWWVNCISAKSLAALWTIDYTLSEKINKIPLDKYPTGVYNICAKNKE